MFDQATVRTGIRYGVTNGIIGFLLILVVYLNGGDPFGPGSLLSYMLLPFFMLAGLNYYRAFREEPMGYGKAFGVALSISLYTAITSALLLYAFTVLAGPAVLQKHLEETRLMLTQNRESIVELFDQERYNLLNQDLEKRGAFQLANEDFMRRIFFGFLVSLIIAIFKRK